MQERDHSIDVLRGIAIFTMIAANSAAYALEEPHPFWFRIYGSIAAPLFITLSGMMVYNSAVRKQNSFSYFLLRAFLIIAVAALIDLCIWKTIPFTTVDVLYLIGVSTPLVYLVRNFSIRAKIALVVFIFAITPLLQHLFGYTLYPTEYGLNGEISTEVVNQTSIVNHWLVDGWFPLFPWLGFAIFGSCLGELKMQPPINKIQDKFLLAGIILLISGIITGVITSPEFLVRSHYSELFYPPSITFILSATGVILLLFYFVNRSFLSPIYPPFKVFGACSLLMYILHLVLISYIIEPYLEAQPMGKFLLVYIVLASVLLGIALLVKYLKSRKKNIPYLLKFLIGS